MNTSYYLDRAVELFKEDMEGNLVGIYLHGSLAMGCFNANTSDIDLLIITHDKLSTENSKRIVQRILKLHESMPNERGIELSIILESELQNFIYPTPFEFHYSVDHRERYVKDENYLCGGFQDPDLAAHFFVTYHRGIALYGKPIKEVFKPIDKEFYIKSILYDVENALTEIVQSPMYYTLNLCRAMLFLQEGVVGSKKEGGEWGLNIVPAQYRHNLQHCLNEYSGLENKTELDSELLISFAEYMLQKIRKMNV